MRINKTLFSALFFAFALQASANTWTALSSGYTSPGYAVSFVNDKIGYVAGASGILQTTNGGTSWNVHDYSTDFTYTSIQFLDSSTGYATTLFSTYLSGYVRKGTHSTYSWASVLGSSTPETAIRGVGFINKLKGCAVGYAGKIVCTSNGGATWTTKTSGTTNHLMAIHFPTPVIGYAVGDAGALAKTSDSGNTWTTMSPISATTAFFAVYFTSASNGYAVGDSGSKVWKTTNGGTSWSSVSSGTTQILRGIFFTDAATGYAVGLTGTILKTINSGATWTAEVSNTTRNLYAVNFPTATTGFVVGDNGTILKTGGASPILNQASKADYGLKFSGNGNFRYTLPAHASVQIRVYDSHGRRLANLINGTQEAGEHTLALPAQNGNALRIVEFRSEGFRKTVKWIGN